MLKQVVFLKDHRCFKKGDTFDFRPGINLLVGDQGTGKSTLLERIRTDGKNQKLKHLPTTVNVIADPIKMMSFDFEKDSPRGKSVFNQYQPMMAQVATLFLSHGQANNGILSELGKQKKMLFIMDEPDMALSIRSCRKLAALLHKAAENGCQIVASAHHPIVISAVPEVYSLEHRKWMGSQEFIDSQV